MSAEPAPAGPVVIVLAEMIDQLRRDLAGQGIRVEGTTK
jgi:hypothetical protein